ncbi:hypothetical protein RND81_09G059400 [Saponaria officinalis]|uniref:Uncharacterized protein n=1 Tax=Saponaria officinalis TaxID=3572 RepID=A0AAW1IJ89_SAPOF
MGNKSTGRFRVHWYHIGQRYKLFLFLLCDAYLPYSCSFAKFFVLLV